MPAPIIEKFSGPINPVKVSQWLQDCEEAFQKHINENLRGDGTKFNDNQKISYTGSNIATVGDTAALANWWKNNMRRLEKFTWDDFRDRLKTQALGPTWKMKALQSFFQLHQGTDSVEDYISKLDEARLVIERALGIPDITDEQYKYQLLFNSSSTIISQVAKLGVTWFGGATDDAVKDEMMQYNEHTTQPDTQSAVPSKVPDHMWVLSGTWGGAPSTVFNDLNFPNFPQAATGIGRVSKILLWDNNNTRGRYLFRRYEFRFIDGELSVSANSLGVESGATSKEIYFDSDEFPVEVTFWRSSYSQLAISGMQIKSTKGHTVQVGTTTQDAVTTKAPPGYQLVGFYGSFLDDTSYGIRYYNRMGAIFAPIGRYA